MHRCRQRGGGRLAGGAGPPPCGQLTHCFSAVAELIVIDAYNMSVFDLLHLDSSCFKNVFWDYFTSIAHL